MTSYWNTSRCNTQILQILDLWEVLFLLGLWVCECAWTTHTRALQLFFSLDLYISAYGFLFMYYLHDTDICLKKPDPGNVAYDNFKIYHNLRSVCVIARLETYFDRWINFSDEGNTFSSPACKQSESIFFHNKSRRLFFLSKGQHAVYTRNYFSSLKNNRAPYPHNMRDYIRGDGHAQFPASRVTLHVWGQQRWPLRSSPVSGLISVVSPVAQMQCQHVAEISFVSKHAYFVFVYIPLRI